MLYILGLVIAIGSLIGAIVHLDQSVLSYYDFVAFVMVVGGTVAVALITLPWELRGEIFRRTGELFWKSSADRQKLVYDCMEVNSNTLKGIFHKPHGGRGIPYMILGDGVELIQLGLSPQKIEIILKERLYQATERARYVGNAIRGLSKYPPAFGLAGTVLGLVHLMRGVSDGMSPQETGIRMAIALVATFYGLLVANLIVNPVGDAIFKNSYDDEKLGEIALQSILLASERTNLLEAQELLNSYVNPGDRVDVIGAFAVEAENEVAA